MRSPHLQGGALLAACAAGQGTMVVVEGEHRQDDEWFYGQWFGHLGPRISFFAQNGWEKVVAAVAYLRAELPHRAVFGIVDGDFIDSAIDTSLEPRILRLPRYTLENYLLEPEGWFRVLELVTRGALPDGWRTVEDVDRRIDEAFGECLPLAAFNRTAFDEHLRHPIDRLKYRAHPDAFGKTNPQALLATWGEHRGVPRLLFEVFEEHLERLRASTRAAWHGEVTGKAVLKVFLNMLMRAAHMPTQAYGLLCPMYLQQQPEPHEDLKSRVDAILALAILDP
jgi:Protein of unknown function (DUF4435)